MQKRFSPKAQYHKRKISFIDILIAFGVICIAAYLTLPKDKTNFLSKANSQKISGFAKINDGDTLTISGKRIRLIDIDAPELEQSCTLDNKKYPCGIESKNYLTKLLKNKVVTCYWNKQDQYKRYLALCEIGTLDINKKMIQEGHALSFYGYKAEEEKARKLKKGIWKTTFITPQQWRKLQ